MPTRAAAARSNANGMRERQEQQSRERQQHADRQRIRLRAPIRVVADDGLQDRRDELIRERDQPDLGEGQMEFVLEQRIERRQQRLQQVVQQMADAQGNEDAKGVRGVESGIRGSTSARVHFEVRVPPSTLTGNVGAALAHAQALLGAAVRAAGPHGSESDSAASRATRRRAAAAGDPCRAARTGRATGCHRP